MRLLSRLFGATSPRSPGTPLVVGVHEARRRQVAGALLIDVRERSEWRQNHAPDAALIPLPSLSQRLAEIPLDRDVLLICRSGNRSATAQRQLLQRGYARVFNVTGGMNAWSSARLPLAP